MATQVERAECADYTVTLLAEEAAPTTLHTLRAGRVAVIDCWTTKCVRCPAAIDKLEKLAARGGAFGSDDVLFCTLNLDDRDLARELVDDQEWPHLAHAFMDLPTKEAAKLAWGFAAVPFIAVVARDGTLHWRGAPKDADLEAVLAEALAQPHAAAAAAPAPAPVVAAASDTTAAAAPAKGAAPVAVVTDENAAVAANHSAPAATTTTPAFSLDEDF